MFFTNPEKYVFLSFQDICYNNSLILWNNVLSYYKALNNDGNKGLLLDVNPKPFFFTFKKCQIMFSKQHSLWTPFLTKCSDCDIEGLT